MPHRQAIELLPVVLPLGQTPIHGRHKALAVAGFTQVGQLVHDHVLQVLGRLLCQVGVQANQSSFWVAAAPLGFHALHEDLPELAALGSRLAKARQINQGMMQELLTGRIRLL